MADPVAIDVASTSRAIDAMLAAYPELMEDEELRADSLEAETPLPELMSRLVRYRQERLALAEGLNGYIKDLTERRDRLTKGADGFRDLMLMLLNAAGLNKLTLTEATVSAHKGRATVSIIDIDALPQGTFKTVRQPDKSAIKAQIDAGHDVPGAAVVTGDPYLTVRVR